VTSQDREEPAPEKKQWGMRYLGRLRWLDRFVVHELKQLWQGKSGWYWAFAFGLLIGGTVLGEFLESGSYPLLQSVRYGLYRRMIGLSPSKTYARDTVIVLIDDDDFWKGEAQGRTPLNRRHLAKLIGEIAKRDPALIAVDVSLSSPDPLGEVRSSTRDQSVTLPVASDFLPETVEFLQQIRQTAQECPVVLAKTIRKEEPSEPWYVEEADVYDGFDFQSSQVTFGYILLKDDVRQVPPNVTVKDGWSIDSFPLAIVRAARPHALKGWDWREAQFGGFIVQEQMSTVAAREVLEPGLHGDALGKRLRHQIVLVGGNWHQWARGRGPAVDQHDTPVGPIPGVFLHANYVETILAHALYPAAPWGRFIEIGLGLILILVLAAPIPALLQLAFVIMEIIASVLLTYFALLLVGSFCDVVVISLLLLGHWVTARMIHPEPHR
jgi:CHASE2 domain-containing sensor protein